MWSHADSFGFYALRYCNIHLSNVMKVSGLSVVLLKELKCVTPDKKCPGYSRKSSQHFWFHMIWVIWTLCLDRSDWINLLVPETVGWVPIDPPSLPLSVIWIQIFLPGPHTVETRSWHRQYIKTPFYSHCLTLNQTCPVLGQLGLSKLFLLAKCQNNASIW